MSMHLTLLKTYLPLLSGVEIALVAVGLGVSLLAATVLSRRKPDTGLSDKTPSTVASRGEFVPYLIGTARLGAVVGWVGELESETEGGGSGGKGGGGGGDEGAVTIYSESAWHQICVGPAKRMLRIWVDGRVIMSDALTPGTTPSGTTVDLGAEGQFALYWGEANQPVNAYLGDPARVTVSSRWPRLCYVVWNKKRLGPQRRWPVIEYEVEAEPQFGTAINGPGAYMTVSGVQDGYNSAYTLETLLRAPYPYGMGLPSTAVDYSRLDVLAQRLGTEQMACAMLASNGATVESVVSEMMTDLGLFLPVVRGRLGFELVRPPELDQPVLTEDIVLPPRPEIERSTRSKAADNLIFKFRDREKAHRQMSVVIDDDGNAALTSRRSGKVVSIETTVNYLTGVRIADRRAQEELAQVVRVRVHASRGARSLYPGKTIVVHDVPFILRVVGVKPDALSGKVDLSCLVDYYGAYTGFLPVPGAAPVPAQVPTTSPGVQIAASPSHVPEYLQTGLVPLAIGWLRPTVRCTGAEIHGSLNGTSYQLLGVDTHTFWGGELLDDFPPGAYFVESGPRYTALGPDEGQALDLSADPDQWTSGRQILIIGQEVLFVRNLQALGSGTYRLRGVLRARALSQQESHLVGGLALMTRTTAAPVWRDSMFAPGSEVHIKVRPLFNLGAVSLSSVSPVTYLVPRPVPHGPVGVRTDPHRGRAGVFAFLEGPGVGGFTVRWGHVNPSPGYPRSGAGLQGAGDASLAAPPLGTFDVELLESDDTPAFMRAGVLSPQYFDGDQVKAAFGGTTPGQFKVRVREVVAGVASDWSTSLVLDAEQP